MIMKEKLNLKKRTLRSQHMVEFVSGLVLFVLLNIVGSYVFYRIDLTSDKRYTLSAITKKLLKEDIKDVVYVKVYLEGDFPAGFKKLSKETREMLDEFRAYNKNIEYEFIDPSTNDDRKQRNEVYKQLITKGLQPTSLQVKDKSGSSQKVIFPGALVTYKGQEIPVQLLQTKMGSSPEEQLNNSIQNLEYELSNAIRKLSIPIKKKIGFLNGHGELDNLEVADMAFALKEYYVVKPVRIDGRINALRGFDALIVASPDSAFNDKDKFVIDQFVMHGGKVLWFVDQVFADLDSLRSDKNEMTAFPKMLDLDYLFFRYGVKIKTDLVQDLQALPIPIQTGVLGDKPQYSPMPWFYFPLVSGASNNPIVKNIEFVKTNFMSSIDTSVITPGIKKTVLLRTSNFSRTVPTPFLISLDLIKETPKQEQYKESLIPAAVLLEGKFESAFKNRLAPEFEAIKDSLNYREQSTPNKMLVVSDGDIIKNQIRISNGEKSPLPLGYDMYSYGYTKTMFGNKNFIMNAVNYMLDDSNLISVRARELKMRLLDKTKIEENRMMYQVLNVVVPVLLVFLFGFILSLLKRRKYTR